MPTVASLLRETAERIAHAGVFLGHGQIDAWDEAAFLVGHVIGELPVIGEEQMRMPVSAARQERLERLLKRRLEDRVPAAYLVGETWFAGVHLICDERALVPRSPIAELIEEGFAPWLRADKPAILELCTGGGAIAVACAVHMPGSRVTATDIDPSALALARINVEHAGVGDRVALCQADLYEGVPAGAYDLIVSNPPYVPPDRMGDLPPEYRHEPERGFVSELDGLELPLRILARAPEYLSPEGLLVMEVGESAERLDAALPTAAWTWLEFARGGEGVLLTSADDLQSVAPLASALLEGSDGR